MRKLYQFPYGPNTNLMFGYSSITLDENSQAEIDEADAELMFLVKSYCGELVKPKAKAPAKVETKTTKKDGAK